MLLQQRTEPCFVPLPVAVSATQHAPLVRRSSQQKHSMTTRIHSCLLGGMDRFGTQGHDKLQELLRVDVRGGVGCSQRLGDAAVHALLRQWEATVAPERLLVGEEAEVLGGSSDQRLEARGQHVVVFALGT